jgi:predicted membrane protein
MYLLHGIYGTNILIVLNVNNLRNLLSRTGRGITFFSIIISLSRLILWVLAFILLLLVLLISFIWFLFFFGIFFDYHLTALMWVIIREEVRVHEHRLTLGPCWHRVLLAFWWRLHHHHVGWWLTTKGQWIGRDSSYTLGFELIDIKWWSVTSLLVLLI